MQTDPAGGISPLLAEPSRGASGGVMSVRGGVGALRAQLFAAAGAAGIQNLAAGLGGHTRAEPMAPLADQVRRLKGAFHRAFLQLRAGNAADSACRCDQKPGLYCGFYRKSNPVARKSGRIRQIFRPPCRGAAEIAKEGCQITNLSYSIKAA